MNSRVWSGPAPIETCPDKSFVVNWCPKTDMTCLKKHIKHIIIVHTHAYISYTVHHY